MVQGSASPGARECMVSSKYKGRGCPLLNKNQRPYAQINVDPRSHKKDHGSTAPEKRKKSFSRKGDVLRKQFLDNFADGIPARYLDGYVVDFIIYHQLLMPLSGGETSAHKSEWLIRSSLLLWCRYSPSHHSLSEYRSGS